MRSGYDNYEGIWGNSYYDDEFGEIEDRDFVQKVFRSRPSLISNTALAPDDLAKHPEARVYEDGTVEIPYTGQDYDKAKFRLVVESWDHVHCRPCRYSVDEGQTYWENGTGDELCDACYEHYVLGAN